MLNKKAKQDDHIDRISNLPINVIDGILEHLDIRDRVRSSVLSTKWRYLWASVPRLEFESKFFDRCTRERVLFVVVRYLKSLALTASICLKKAKNLIDLTLIAMECWESGLIKSLAKNIQRFSIGSYSSNKKLESSFNSMTEYGTVKEKQALILLDKGSGIHQISGIHRKE
ncbi:F-box/FBD/LRR-repeat protein [Trifolium pratense]|uniref:F-box/FBD/LRR-repeat protein n=1 Tax=Trifolium pratense TaxID=57577 RepID=A0A2K3KYW8_TRIPR|nr:F-box/FBD/LRR-repeat protein [Trifolium pratense]